MDSGNGCNDFAKVATILFSRGRSSSEVRCYVGEGMGVLLQTHDYFCLNEFKHGTAGEDWAYKKMFMYSRVVRSLFTHWILAALYD